MKAKDTLLLNNTITQNPILARRAWFWHVSSHYVIGTFLFVVHRWRGKCQIVVPGSINQPPPNNISEQ